MNWLCLDLKFVVGPWVRTHDMISVDFDFYNPEVQTAFSKKWLMGMTLRWSCLLCFSAPGDAREGFRTQPCSPLCTPTGVNDG